MSLYYVQLPFSNEAARDMALGELGKEPESDLTIAIKRVERPRKEDFYAPQGSHLPGIEHGAPKIVYKQKGVRTTTEKTWGHQRKLPTIDAIVEAASEEELQPLIGERQDFHVRQVSEAYLELQLISLNQASFSRFTGNLGSLCRQGELTFEQGQIGKELNSYDKIVKVWCDVQISGPLQVVLGAYKFIQDAGTDYQSFRITFL